MFYFLSKLPTAIFTVILVATVCFFLTKAAGEEAAFGERNPSELVRAEVSKKWGLDRPIGEQYIMHMKKLLVFDSMESRKQKNKTMRDILKSHFPSSLRLGVRAIIIATVLGIPIGVLCALYQNRLPDNAGSVAALVGVSVPSFVLASFAIYFLCRRWDLLPTIGWDRPEEWIKFPADTIAAAQAAWSGKVAEGSEQFSQLTAAFYLLKVGVIQEVLRLRLWIPAACLAAFPFAAILRLTRGSMVESLRQDYVRTARAKGLSSSGVIIRHALRNALTPVVTYIGPVTAGVLTGSLVVERIFAIPGLGKFFVDSVNNRDMPLIMGLTVFYSALLIGMNLLVDAIYPILNPRLKT